MSPLTVLARTSTWSWPSCGLAGALQVGADRAGDGGDVGPHRDAGRDADRDVAGGALDGDAGRGGRGRSTRSPLPVLNDVSPCASPTSRSPRAGLDDGGAAGVLDGDVAGAGRDRDGAAGLADLDVAGAALDLAGRRARRRPGCRRSRSRRAGGPSTVSTADVAGAAAQLARGRRVPSTLDVGAAGADRRVAAVGHDDVDVERVVAEDAAAAGLDDADRCRRAARRRRRRRRVPVDGDGATRWCRCASTSTVPLPISTNRLTGLWVSKRYSGMAVLLGAGEGVLVRGTGAAAGPGVGWSVVGLAWWLRPSRSSAGRACRRTGPARRTGRCRRRTGGWTGRCRR